MALLARELDKALDAVKRQSARIQASEVVLEAANKRAERFNREVEICARDYHIQVARAHAAETERNGLLAVVNDCIEMCRNADFGATAIYVERKRDAALVAAVSGGGEQKLGERRQAVVDSIREVTGGGE